MKLCVALLLLPAASVAFAPSASFMRTSSSLRSGNSNFDLSGNTWKPDSEKMGSTDTGDYFPEGYDPNESGPAFSEGMGGSQAMLGGGNGGPQLPGMENLGADAVVQGGIELASEIPDGMDFTPDAFPDKTIEFNVASSSEGVDIEVAVTPVCMTFEDYFVAMAPGSNRAFTIGPATGRMDRRGGEVTMLTLHCEPQGQAGDLVGDMVLNMPEDNSKICYKIIAHSQ